MSSKSRNKSGGSSKKGDRQRPRSPGLAAAQAQEPPPARSDPDEEVVHVPKGKNPVRFVLTVALVILLLVIFIVPQAIMGAFRGGEDTVAVSWRMPDGEEVALGQREWTDAIRGLSDVTYVDPLLAGLFGGRRPDDEGVARFLLLDRLAEESGLHVSREDLRQHVETLVSLYGDVETYKRVTRSVGGPSRVEATMARVLRAMRMLQIGSYVAAVPGPEEIEELWAAEHEDYAFDLAFLEIEGLEDEVRDEVPEDEELRAWLEGLPAERTASLRRPERRAAELAVFRDFESTPATGLLERYPQEPDAAEGEGDPAAEEARRYHGQVAFRRFLQPPSEEEGQPDSPRAVPFEEMEERAREEAPVYFALQAWLDDLRDREGEGEEIDLEAEAEALGLDHERTELLSREEYRDMEERRVVGDAFANAVFGLQPGAFGYVVIARPDILAVPRVTERAEPSIPPLEEIHDEVVAMWIRDRARDLAVERVQGIRRGFSEEPPAADDGEEAEEQAADGEDGEAAARHATAEEFRSAVEEAGLEVHERAWSDKAFAEPDPDLDAATNDFFARHRELFSLEEGEVAEAAASTDGTRLYLVRVSGRRPVPIERMSPQDFDRFLASGGEARRRKLVQGFDTDYMRERFALAFASPGGDEEDEEAGAEPEE